ncbi:NETI motif-containing protein [Bacillus methanolicus]|uniref:NETI motif-containing protein n=1 Tax=Bacillus methanolicus TaxID=1471 RepID=UPI00201044FA|nr:NETI motif-containing protein [Bacillus methanolicus]UQD50892.1 NETI motif-containing protein [Bacillus methanolicus]
MSKEKKKLLFEVKENETIDQCLERMKKEGYTLVRRMEKPIFQEVKKGDSIQYEPIGRQIVFEAKKID